MQLSPEARKRAVDAFKQEIKTGLAVLRMSIAAGPADWPAKEVKALLHKLKGGAGFLGYEELRETLAKLEAQSLVYPESVTFWSEFVDKWDRESQSLV